MKRRLLSERSCRFFLAFLALLLLCVLPLQPQLYQMNSKNVQISVDEPQNVSVKENLVEQALIAEGNMRTLSIYLSAPSGSLYQDAELTFSILQEGERIASKTVSARSVVSGMYELDDLAKKVKTGEALLQIKGEGFPEGTDLYCLSGVSLTSGLPAARYNGSPLTGPLAVSYRIFKLDGYFLYDTVLLTLLVLAVAGTAWLLAAKRDWLIHGNGLYLCSFLLIFLFVSLNNPLASFLGEPRSEMAYEFWYKAHTMGFWKSLMSLMSGEALAWTERVLMWLADALFPTRYVFMAAQCMQLLFICSAASMFSLKTFQRYFGPEFRLAVCFLIGTSVLFREAYYFWAVSYWAPLFLIAFSFVDMDRLKSWQYGLALLVTVVLCVSRIYHAVFIPIALWMIILLYKKRGRRFAGYMLTAALSSAFEVGYSFLAGAGEHLSAGAPISLISLVGNTLYYQIQVMGSLLLGKSFQLAAVANATMLLLFVAIVGLFLYYWIFSPQPRPIGRASALGALGMLSLGTIMINVVTCAMSSTVAFPHNYASPVSWTQRYYQEADLHFSYAYFAIIAILLVLLYSLKAHIKTQMQAIRLKQKEIKPVIRTVRRIGLGASALAAVLFCGRQLMGGPPISHIETDWKSISDITNQNSYYAAINVSYGNALISLEHNSHGLLYGVDEMGKGYFWTPGSKEYTHDYPYHTADVGASGNIEEQSVIALTARRTQLNFASPYIAVFYDREGNELARLKQANNPTRIMTDFFPEEPLQNVYRVAFENEDGTPAYVCDALQFGVKNG